MTADRLLVIMARVTAKYQHALVNQYTMQRGGEMEHGIVISEGDKVIAYVNIDSGRVHAEQDVEL